MLEMEIASCILQFRKHVHNGFSVFIEKEECTSHITKRLGTGLQKIVRSCKGKKLADGKEIRGQGSLTIKRIDTTELLWFCNSQQQSKCQSHGKGHTSSTETLFKHH